MDYAKISEETLDEIMQKIRVENGMTKKDIDDNKQIRDINDADYEIIDKYLNDGIIGKQIGLNKAPMSAKRGISLKVSRIIEKFYLRVSQLITRDIRDFNSIVLSLVHALKRKLITVDNNNRNLVNNIEKLNKEISNLNVKITQLEDISINKIDEIDKKLNSYNEENSVKINFIEDNFRDEFLKYKENIKNIVKDSITSISKENNERMFVDEKSLAENISLIIDKYNQNKILIRELNEEIYKLKSIVTWVNKEEFSESVTNKVGNETLSNPLFYHDFEEKFRGTRNDIKERLLVYVPIIDELFGEWNNKKFIDIGCGRGEWLDILKDKGVTEYLGVDINDLQLNTCNEYGHKTINNDCLEYIKKLADESIDMVSGFHIIEHLPIEKLLALLNECNRVLKKGGVVLFETPNPNNLITSATYFYADPTHNKPLYNETMKFFVEHSGFEKVEIIEVNSARFSKALITPTSIDGNQIVWEENINILNSLLYGAQDYAVMGVK